MSSLAPPSPPGSRATCPEMNTRSPDATATEYGPTGDGADGVSRIRFDIQSLWELPSQATAETGGPAGRGSAEAVAAPAGAGDVGIVDGEPGPHEPVLEVESGSPDHLRRLGIHHDPHVAEFFNDIALFDLAVEEELVRETGASAGTYRHAKGQARLALGRDQLTDFGHGRVGESDGGLRLAGLDGQDLCHRWITDGSGSRSPSIRDNVSCVIDRKSVG